MSQKITLDQWLAELESDASTPDGISAQELADKLGHGIDWTHKFIRLAIGSGRIRFSGRRKSQAIDGKISWTPVYQLTKSCRLRRGAS